MSCSVVEKFSVRADVQAVMRLYEKIGWHVVVKHELDEERNREIAHLYFYLD